MVVHNLVRLLVLSFKLLCSTTCTFQFSFFKIVLSNPGTFYIKKSDIFSSPISFKKCKLRACLCSCTFMFIVPCVFVSVYFYRVCIVCLYFVHLVHMSFSSFSSSFSSFNLYMLNMLVCKLEIVFVQSVFEVL
jgi:hypothetical protein